MNDITPCWTDCDDNRLPADEPEAEDPRTEMEKRISWLCSEWATAQECDTFDEWSGVRLMLAGATQALIYTTGRHEDYKALDAARDMAFEYSLACIQQGKYEGSPA